MRLWQHKNGIWYVLYGPELKRRISTGTRDRGEADTFLAQFILGMQNPKPDNPTLTFLLDHYYLGHSADVRAPKAMKYGVDALKRHLGTLRPEQLLPTTFTDYARKRKAEDVGRGTILREMGILRAAGEWVIAHKVIDAASWPQKIKSPVKRPRPKEIWLRRDQAPKLIQSAHLPHLWLFIKMGLMTLARSAAILECQWEPKEDAEGRTLPHVNFDRRLIDYGEGFGNKRRALVPINDELLADLTAARRIARTPHVIEYQGEPVKWIKNSFAGAVERAGLPDNITPHILRHTGCTWLVEDGISYEEIGKMAGDTAETIETVYGHHSPAFLAKAAASLQLEKQPA